MSTSIEQRLNCLEAALGIKGSDDAPDIQSRVQTLLESTNSQTSQAYLDSNLKECDKLARELCPSGLLLTSATTDPINASAGLARHEELLARYEELQNAFEKLAKIRDTLMISNPALAKELQAKAGSGGKNESVDHIVSAPILASSSFTFAADPVNEERLNTLTDNILDVRDRSSSLARKVDGMVDRYYSVMNAVNEKMVLLQEEGTM